MNRDRITVEELAEMLKKTGKNSVKLSMRTGLSISCIRDIIRGRRKSVNSDTIYKILCSMNDERKSEYDPKMLEARIDFLKKTAEINNISYNEIGTLLGISRQNVGSILVKSDKANVEKIDAIEDAISILTKNKK